MPPRRARQSKPAAAAPPPAAPFTPTASSTASKRTTDNVSNGASIDFAGLVLALITLLASSTLYLHYKLPTPKPSTSIIAAGVGPELATAYDPTSPVILNATTASRDAHAAPASISTLFSEANAVSVMHHLSVGIGYRIVGTKQHVQAEDWLEQVLRRYEGWHHTVKPADDNQSGNARRTQVEVWKQIGDGAHRFDFMSSVVWKKYYSMSNLVVRLSDGTDESKANALLLNAHLDSTLPSPGGADDGIGVSILLEALRILTLPNTGRRLHNSVILLFNNVEESLQDASHLYITQHNETEDTVRAVVNLEACGTSGPELFFQATSNAMIEAYSKVPHPYGTVLANDVFSTGLILSDTDFRQFVQYSNGFTGLDMALVGSSYLYHTRKDVPAYLEPGATQHFGENVLAVLEHLCLNRDAAALLPGIPRRRQSRASLPVYFSLAGRKFFLISNKAFKSIVLGLSTIAQIQLTSVTRAESHLGALKMTMLSACGTVASLLAAIAGANAVALLMTQVLGRGMSWFSHEWAPAALYGPPALASILGVQYAMAHLVPAHQRPYFERATLAGMQIIFTLTLLCLNAFSIGSAYLMVLAAGTLLVSVTVNDFILIGMGNIEMKAVAPDVRVHPWTYLLLILVPSTIGFEGMASFLDLFTPLTGRMGEISPADNILATIVSVLLFLSLPVMLPLSHRFPTATLRRAILGLVALSTAMVAIFAVRAPFDALHPKRLFVHQVQNITSGDWFMNLGSADPAPGFGDLANEVQGLLGRQGETAVLHEMNDQYTAFDILYPVSDFLTPYKFQVPSPEPLSAVARYAAPAPTSQHFTLVATNETINLDASTRRVTLEIHHPGIIWPVIAFWGDVLEWSLPSAPPSGHQQHHIKQVGRYGLSTWSVDLLLRLDSEALSSASQRSRADYGKLVRREDEDEVRDASRLWIDMSGLVVDEMFPQHRQEARGRYAMENFEKMDSWLQEKHPEVDAMLLSVVAAVVVA